MVTICDLSVSMSFLLVTEHHRSILKTRCIDLISVRIWPNRKRFGLATNSILILDNNGCRFLNIAFEPSKKSKMIIHELDHTSNTIDRWRKISLRYYYRTYVQQINSSPSAWFSRFVQLFNAFDTMIRVPISLYIARCVSFRHVLFLSLSLLFPSATPIIFYHFPHFDLIRPTTSSNNNLIYTLSTYTSSLCISSTSYSFLTTVSEE